MSSCDPGLYSMGDSSIILPVNSPFCFRYFPKLSLSSLQSILLTNTQPQYGFISHLPSCLYIGYEEKKWQCCWEEPATIPFLISNLKWTFNITSSIYLEPGNTFSFNKKTKRHQMGTPSTFQTPCPDSQFASMITHIYLLPSFLGEVPCAMLNNGVPGFHQLLLRDLAPSFIFLSS